MIKGLLMSFLLFGGTLGGVTWLMERCRQLFPYSEVWCVAVAVVQVITLYLVTFAVSRALHGASIFSAAKLLGYDHARPDAGLWMLSLGFMFCQLAVLGLIFVLPPLCAWASFLAGSAALWTPLWAVTCGIGGISYWPTTCLFTIRA